MEADAGVETPKTAASSVARAKFVERLGARIRTLSNYDIERLNDLLESAWLGTQMTWRSRVSQRGDDVPDDVLAAIPLVALDEVTDYWDVINRPTDPWREGKIAIFRPVAEAQRGRGVGTTQGRDARYGFWNAWELGSIRRRIFYAALLVAAEGILVWIATLGNHPAAWYFYVTSGVGVVFVALGAIGVRVGTRNAGLESRFVRALAVGIHGLSADDLAALISTSWPDGPSEDSTSRTAPLRASLAGLDWNSFISLSGIRAAVEDLAVEWRPRLIRVIGQLIALEQSYGSDHAGALIKPRQGRRRVIGFVVCWAAAAVVLILGVLALGYLPLNSTAVGAIIFPAVIFGSLGYHFGQRPRDSSESRLDEIVRELYSPSNDLTTSK